MEPEIMNLRALLLHALPAPGMETINFHILHKILEAIIDALELDEIPVDISNCTSLIPLSKCPETPSPIRSTLSIAEHVSKEMDKQLHGLSSQVDSRYKEVSGSMTQKFQQVNANVSSLNDYVARCMQVISSSVGISNMPDPFATRAKTTAETILCDIIGTIDAPTSVCDRLSELERDQVKQWDDITSVRSSFEKYAKDTDALIENVKALQCKSKQMLDYYTCHVANTQKTLDALTKANESMEKQVNGVSVTLEREKKIANHTRKCFEDALEQKVEKYDLDNLKTFVKLKVDGMRRRASAGSTKFTNGAYTKLTNGMSDENQNNDGAELRTSKSASADGMTSEMRSSKNGSTEGMRYDEDGQHTTACSNKMAKLEGRDMTTCACSYVKGANGAVYRGNCVCCKLAAMNLQSV